MKQTITIIFMTFAVFSFGQDINVLEPEYLGNIEYVNDSSITIKLEKQKCGIKGKSNAATFVPYAGLVAGKTKVMNTVQGLKSPIRISNTKNYRFIIKVSDNRVDPFGLISIFRLEQNSKKNYRFIETSNSSVIGGTSIMEIEYIKFQAKKYGESSFLLEIVHELSPGEYAITIEGSRDVFNMFGVD